jgi:lysophospholipase L1-like esterase
MILVLALVAACSESARSQTPSSQGGADRGPSESPTTSWSYVAFGDSVTFGSGDVSGASFVGILARLIEEHGRVSVAVHNLAFDGGTSQDLLDALQHNPDFQQALAHANLLTIDIGGNDIESGLEAYSTKTCGGQDNRECFRTGLAAFKGRWAAILAIVVKARPPSVAAIRVLTAYDNFVGNAQAAANLGPTIARDIGPYLDELNDYRCSSAMAYGIPCVDIARAFNGPSRHGAIPSDLMGSDGIHPSAKGHLLIAQTIDAAGYAPLP